MQNGSSLAQKSGAICPNYSLYPLGPSPETLAHISLSSMY